MLLPLGFEVDQAENGAEALQHAELYRPDLVLTDIVMPVLDGLGLIRRLLANQASRSIPVHRGLRQRVRRRP